MSAADASSNMQVLAETELIANIIIQLLCLVVDYSCHASFTLASFPENMAKRFRIVWRHRCCSGRSSGMQTTGATDIRTLHG